MAYSSFSLPALRIPRHDKPGSKSVNYISRTLPKKSSSTLSPDELQEPVTLGDEEGSSHMVTPLDEPSPYESEMKAAVVGWEQIRRQMLKVVVEGAGM